MSVRHIHASPGEYIAVHRNGGYRPTHGGGSGSDGMGCLCIIGIILIFCFWKEILIISFFLGILALVGWLIWTFRTQIGKGICIAGIAIWHGCCYVLSYVCIKIKAAYNAIRNRLAQRTKNPQPIGSCSSSKQSTNYGKIIQKF